MDKRRTLLGVLVCTYVLFGCGETQQVRKVRQVSSDQTAGQTKSPSDGIEAQNELLTKQQVVEQTFLQFATSIQGLDYREELLPKMVQAVATVENAIVENGFDLESASQNTGWCMVMAENKTPLAAMANDFKVLSGSWVAITTESNKTPEVCATYAKDLTSQSGSQQFVTFFPASL